MKREQDLNEYKQYSYTILWNPISKGIANVKKALKLSIKDLWGSVSYAFKITVETDEKKIQELKSNRQVALNRLSEEYKQLWGDIVETNEDFSAFAMLAAPGPYMVSYFSMNGRAHLNDIQQFCKNAGITSEVLEGFLGNPAESPEDAEYIKRMMLRRNTRGSQKSRVEDALKDVIGKITKIMQLEDASMSEYAGVKAIRLKLLHEKESKDLKNTSSPSDELFDGYMKLFQSDEFAKAIKDKIDNKKILKAKQDELEAYVAALDTPAKFINQIESAKDLREISIAYKTLGNSILKIEGLDNTDPIKKVQATVDEMYQKIKNDNTAKEAFIKSAEIKVDPKLKEKYAEEHVKAAITKIVSIKQLEQIKEVVSSEDTQKSLEIARNEFIESFRSGLDDKLLSSMKKIDPALPNLIETGVEKIKKAGLLKK